MSLQGPKGRGEEEGEGGEEEGGGEGGRGGGEEGGGRKEGEGERKGRERREEGWGPLQPLGLRPSPEVSALTYYPLQPPFFTEL